MRHHLFPPKTPDVATKSDDKNDECQHRIDSLGIGGPVERLDFPNRAYAAIARLDPREDIVVAFDFASGTRCARFEVRDFVTGLASIPLPSPYRTSES